jgi:hypothetical protein
LEMVSARPNYDSDVAQPHSELRPECHSSIAGSCCQIAQTPEADRANDSM